jgi:Luciferase
MTIAAGRLKDEVSSWPGVSVHPHRFAAREYRVGKAEVGHVHFWGDVDIPFPRPVHDFLLESHLAEQHRWVPDSGWTTFHIHDDGDVGHAIWLMRLSYLRYALKSSTSPSELLETEAERLHLSPDLMAILSRFIPAKVTPVERVDIRA